MPDSQRDSMIDYLTALGVTSVELLPVHAFVDDYFLQQKGLRNYWGYNTIGFFAPHARLRLRPRGDRSTSSRRWCERCTRPASR